MTEKEREKLEQLKAVGFLLSVADTTADIPTEILNRIGDLIQDNLETID